MTPLVTVFDLDGTLTRSDTSVAFLRFVAGSLAVARGLAAAGAAAAPDLVRAWRRETREPRVGGTTGRWEALLHERIIRRTLRGRPREELRERGAAFAAALVADSLRDDVLRRLEDHRARGDRVIVASASLDLYVEPAARLLGCDAGVGSHLEFHGGVATGHLAGLPCWGEEKLRRVRAILEPGTEIAHAYGNSAGDEALFRVAREGRRV
ncbi:MAG: hypothetical protein AMXMBFR53_20050 [Gemmatimonadota bacterium]